MFNISFASRTSAISAMLVICAALSACAASPQAGDAVPSSASPANEAPEPGSTVRLLTHDSFVLSEQTIADFKAKTGLDLQVVTAGDAGSMVAGAILAAGQPTADVLFGVDNTLAARAIDAATFEPYRPAGLTDLNPALLPGDGVLTPIDYGDVCVNVDDGWFTKAGIPAPSTLADLTDPIYRDLLVVQDPATSSPGLAFLLATISRYPDSWTDYWSALLNNGVKVAGSWSDAYLGDFTAGGGGGDRPLVVSYATSPPAEIVYAEDPKPTKPSTSVMTDGCYRQVEYAGVLAGAANPAGARAVIDWLISPEVQQDIPLNMFVFPARTGTALPQVFTDFAAAVDKPLQLPAADVAQQLPEWLDSWGTVMGR
jgi:thiamine transport system substrate-binding protein